MTSLKVRLTARLGNFVGMGHWARCTQLARELIRRQHKVFLMPVADQLILPGDLPPSIGQPLDSVDVEIIDDPINPFELFGPARKRVGLDHYGAPQSFDLIISSIDRTPPEIKSLSKTRFAIGLEYLIFEPHITDCTMPSNSIKHVLITIGGRDGLVGAALM